MKRPDKRTDDAVTAFIVARSRGLSVEESRDEAVKAEGDDGFFAQLSASDLIEWIAVNPAFGNRRMRRATRAMAKREK